jgi:hypothetical protein
MGLVRRNQLTRSTWRGVDLVSFYAYERIGRLLLRSTNDDQKDASHDWQHCYCSAGRVEHIICFSGSCEKPRQRWAQQRYCEVVGDIVLFMW